MANPTVFRQTVAAGIKTMLDGYKAANPTLLRSTFITRPPSLNDDLPAAWVGARNETVVHDSGERIRQMAPTVVVVDRITDNGETLQRMDILVDSLLDYFTANTHIPGIGASAIWAGTMSIADVSETQGAFDFQAVQFTFEDIIIMEGRL